MSPSNLSPAMIILIVVAILAIGVAVWMYMQKRKTQELRTKFGPEYEKAVDTHKDRSHAESELEKREKRVAQFHVDVDAEQLDEPGQHAEVERGGEHRRQRVRESPGAEQGRSPASESMAAPTNVPRGRKSLRYAPAGCSTASAAPLRRIRPRTGARSTWWSSRT